MDYSKKTCKDLKDLCKKNSITCYSNKNKGELIKLLVNHQSNTPQTPSISHDIISVTAQPTLNITSEIMVSNNKGKSNVVEEKIYLAVSFEEKDDAKQLGARWDKLQKEWYYVPKNTTEHNAKTLEEKYKAKSGPIMELVGEDRTFGGNDLFVDLIPRSCWFTNVRTCIHPTEWNRLRKYVYGRANYTCECCGMNTNELEAHERWLYDHTTHTQKLVRLVALCNLCHLATHMGYASVSGREELAYNHLKTTRNFTDEECKNHIDDAFMTWNNRNIDIWSLDLSLIENNNIKPIKRINKEERSSISSQQLEDLQ